MKRNLTAFVALLLALTVCFSMAGCGEEPMSDNVIKGTLKGTLVADKFGTVDTDDFTAYRGGLIYQDKDSGLYGMTSLEGRYDTGAVYAHCAERGLYFQVTLKALEGSSSIADVNTAGLINSKGQTVIPHNYAYFYVINDRFVQAYKALERTSLLSETLLWQSDSGFISAVGIGSNVAQYSAEWVIYDMVEGKVVPGLSSTTDGTVVVKGNTLTYSVDDKYITIDNNGQPAPECETRYDDGSYAVESDNEGKIYNDKGELLFTYDLKGFIPASLTEDEKYYVCSNYSTDKTLYKLADKEGNFVSAEFDEFINVKGDVVFAGEKLYNFQGKQIIDGVYSNVKFDNMFGKNYMLYQNDTYRLINSDGSAIFTFKEKDAQVTDFTASTKKGDENYVYCYKDEDFTIKGYSFAPWLAKTEGANGLYNIVDTMSGKTLIEGYEKYDYSTFDGTKLYVYAYYEGGADMYVIIDEAQLAAIKQKKADLLADLTAAFKAEGINIAISENGEMSLDTSVLFGGDSAVLTADGKAFLNKFIKVYNNIAFSEKYEGFISKTLVEGHIAPVKGSTYDSGYPLSIERATNVLNYCLSKDTGVNLGAFADEFEAIGYSNTQPVYNDNGEVNMAASRRVSFRFMVALEMIG